MEKTLPATSLHPIVLLLWVGIIVSLVLLALVFDKHKRKRYEEAMQEDLIEKCRPQCEKCGYTVEDARTHMDHHLCDGQIPSEHMEAMRQDSMEECWDKINACVIPNVSQMRQELSDAGWLQKNAVEYQSPCGKLYRGPYGAWKAMKQS